MARGAFLVVAAFCGCRLAFVNHKASLRPPPRAALRAEGPSPEAWRDFRAQLISSGLRLTTDGEGDKASAERRSVSKQNEELLRSQNKELWQEYISGAWAHESPVEAGGLLCKQPLAAQLVKEMRLGGETYWGGLLKEKLKQELPAPTEGRTSEEVFESWARNTKYMYRLAEGVVQRSMEELEEQMKGGIEKVDMRVLKSLKSEMDTWQAVALVLKAEGDVAQDAVVINRPLARRVDVPLASFLMNGAMPGMNPKHDEEAVRGCAMAFGREAGIYYGGPHANKAPGILVHGFEELEGAQELAPGTGIYVGGELAAIDGILEGKYSALDFRWFLGRHRNLATGNEWLPLACSRPVALKQCLGLPKPLWHEVMELVGGDKAEISLLELTKRTDLDGEVQEETAKPL